MRTLLLISLLTLCSLQSVFGQDDMVDQNQITFSENSESAIQEYLVRSDELSKNDQLDSAEYYLVEAERLAQALEDKSLLGNVKYQQARLLDRQSLYLQSVDLYKESILLFGSINDSSGLAKTHNKLGAAYKHLNRYSQAFQELNMALRYFIDLDDSLGQAATQLNIGNVFKNIGKPDKAKESYRRALSIYAKYDVQKSIGNVYNNLGNVFKNEQHYDSAFHYMFKTMRIRKSMYDSKGLSYVYHNLANLQLRLDRTDSALYYIDQSYALKRDLNSPYGWADDYTVYAAIYMQKKEWQKATTYLNDALHLLDNLGAYELEIEVLSMLGDCYMELKDYEAAASSFKLKDLKEDLLREQNPQVELEYEFIEYELLRDSLQTSELKLRKELEEAELKNKQLTDEVFRRNVFLIIVGLLLALFIIVPLLIRYRRKLKVEQQSKQELEARSVPKEEKVILLKEVHHRVKNNFQIINSLIRIQSGFMNESNFRIKLKDIENRIRSMSLIHERLYKNDKISSLNVKDYLTELTDHIVNSYETDAKLDLIIEVDDVEYGIDTLIPLGLIMNEAISNSIKHAFKEKENGCIKIGLSNTEDSSILEIADDGIGTDTSLEELKEGSLGMELISDLTEQLDGKMELQSKNGFTYKFIFPRLK